MSSAFGEFYLLFLFIGELVYKCNCPFDNADVTENTVQGGFCVFFVHRAPQLYRRVSLYPPIRSLKAPVLRETVEYNPVTLY
jgi:hypothetical protein